MPARSSKLLLDEYPLILLPTAACVFGDRAAIFIQQVHYWCKIYERKGKLRHYHAGRWWVWNTLHEWHTQFPFWSTRSIERIITRTADSGILLINNYNLLGYDRTRWYTLDYNTINSLIDDWHRKQSPPPSCQIDMMEQATLTDWIMPERHDGSCQSGTMDHDTLTCTIPETTHRVPDTNADMATAWRTCTQELALVLPRHVRLTCLDHAQLTAYDPTGPTATITCSNPATCLQFASQLHKRILVTLAAILTQPNLSIEYVERTQP